MPEAGHGAEQLVAFAAKMQRLNVAHYQASEEKRRLRDQLRAAGFNLQAFNIAVKRRGEGAIGMPWQQLSPVPEAVRELVQRYEAILMHADDQHKAENASRPPAKTIDWKTISVR